MYVTEDKSAEDTIKSLHQKHNVKITSVIPFVQQLASLKLTPNQNQAVQEEVLGLEETSRQRMEDYQERSATEKDRGKEFHHLSQRPAAWSRASCKRNAAILRYPRPRRY